MLLTQRIEGEMTRISSCMIAICLTAIAAIAGCADEVETQTAVAIGEIAEDGRVDLANGDDAEALGGSMTFSASADGQSSFLFRNEMTDHASGGTGSPSQEAFTFGRTLGAGGVSAAMAFGEHASLDQVNGSFLVRAYSPSKRYSAFLVQGQAGVSRYLIVYDSITNRYLTPVKVWANTADVTATAIPTWQRGVGNLSVAARVTLTNNGLVTVLTLADDAAGDPGIYATQYRIGESGFVRGPTRITAAFAQAGNAANSISDVRVVQSMAGAIGVAYAANDFFDSTQFARVLRFAFYDVSNNVWNAPVRVDNEVNENFIPIGFNPVAIGGSDNYILDADYRSFQLVFWQTEGAAPGAKKRLYSRRLDSSSTFTFSSPTIIDAIDATATLDLSVIPDVHFGLNGFSIVTFLQRESAGRTVTSLYGSYSSTTLAPSASRTSRLDGLSTSQASNDGAFTRAPGVWFNGDNDALILFPMRNGNDDEELFQASFSSATATLGFTAANPVDTDFSDVISNTAFEANPVSTRDKTIVEFHFSGWDSQGRALVVWNARLSDAATGNTQETRVYVRMLNGLSADANEFRIDNLSSFDLVSGSLRIASQANPRTLAGYDTDQDAVDPDRLPGGGSGKVIVAFMQPSGFGSFTANRAYVWDWLPGVESGLSADPWEVPLTGWIDSIDFISPGIAAGQVLVGVTHNGLKYSSAKSAASAWTTPARYAHADMLASDGSVLFTDGYTTSVTADAMTLMGGSYAFAIQQGTDGTAQRIFAAKLR